VTSIPSTPAPSIDVLLIGGARAPTLRRALEKNGHRATVVEQDAPLDDAAARAEVVIIATPRESALAICRRLKTRHQVPLLPVIALLPRPAQLPVEPNMPDAWLSPGTRSRDVVARVEELARIRRTESELVRLNRALAELAAENGRLYDRARREAAATTLLLRELQHRVRNNLAAIQALLVLERHRAPARTLGDALDVAIGRLRSMAALQDALTEGSESVKLAALATAVTRGVFDVFGASGVVRYGVSGDATVSARAAGAIAIVLNELVTNALKHASASEICVSIRASEERLVLVVEDDGQGMPQQPPPGSGLTIARAVARNELGGELSFEAARAGTRARLDLPREPSPTDARRAANPSAAGRT
jgi:two-component sensor histidine kinase